MNTERDYKYKVKCGKYKCTQYDVYFILFEKQVHWKAAEGGRSNCGINVIWLPNWIGGTQVLNVEWKRKVMKLNYLELWVRK